ncbi:MAG: bifunctional N-acetylglucosamine-1-phosphate uridyltransferase/glucosamine-1-phosphate acetyltransferase, partial [Candidatus Competibacteraceae bacterium]|nr:bifunctional N-acetylglucosamine-1-phosphate uridyltransferase/glucosamine-1-phosphate acetyltransferase [Candidatus Competibacteraceae bacterium]
MSLSVVILAAGQGKRMYSDLPKVLHKVGAKSMLQHVLDTVQALQADQCIVVYGHGGEQVLSASYTRDGLEWVEQTEQLGTGHAVAQAAPLLRQDGIVLILYGDVPLLRADTLNPILASARQGALGVLTAQLDKPDGYGRIVRDAAQQVLRIVEDKDASPAEKAIGEINTGILALSADRLCEWIGQLNNDNAQGEYYLTDIIEMAVAANVRVDAHIAPDPMEIQGINNRRQLAEVERYYQRRQAAELLLQGVTLRDPDRIDIRGTLKVGRDVCIDINAVFEGEVTLGDGV